MTLYSATFQSQTDGATASAAATGFDSVVGTAPVFDDRSGDIGIDYSGIASGTQSYHTRTLAGTKYAQVTIVFTPTGTPAAAHEPLHIRSTGSPIKASDLLFSSSSGNPTCRFRGGNNTALTGWTSSTVLAAGTFYMLQVAFDAGTTTSDGRTKAKLTRISDSTVMAEGEHTGLNNSGATAGSIWLGKQLTTSALPLWVGSVAVNDSAYAYLDAPTDPVTAPVFHARVGGAWVAGTLKRRSGSTWV